VDDPDGRPDATSRAGEARQGRLRRAIARLPLAARAGLVVLLLAVLAAGAVEWRSLAKFHAITPWATPARVHYCGRDFVRGSMMSLQTASAFGDGGTWRQVMRGPLGQPIYALLTPADQRQHGEPCTMGLFLSEGSDYRAYGLSGGP
jgi:hypothetical protein